METYQAKNIIGTSQNSKSKKNLSPALPLRIDKDIEDVDEILPSSRCAFVVSDF